MDVANPGSGIDSHVVSKTRLGSPVTFPGMNAAKIPTPVNEPVFAYAPGSRERGELKQALKAADLLATRWRAMVNAATMLGQSKTAFQAEIDAACELIDFWRFNVHYAERIHAEQPLSVAGSGMWNALDYRGLEGFVYAITPFNFTAIGGNLPTAPAMMGCTVVWKPAATAAYSNYLVFRLLQEAGLPPGVINFVPGPATVISERLLADRHLGGIH